MSEDALRYLAVLIIGYESHLKDLRRDTDEGHLDPKGMSLSGVFARGRELDRLLALVREGTLVVSPHTTPAKVEARLQALHEERATLLARLTDHEIQQQLSVGCQTLVDWYVGGLETLSRMMNELTWSEYEELQLDDQLSDFQLLTIRNKIGLLLPEVSGAKQTASSSVRLIAGDRILREEGRQLYGPLIHAGIYQRNRETGLEPVERWWWYLDQPES